jgi:hypothetical protein
LALLRADYGAVYGLGRANNPNPVITPPFVSIEPQHQQAWFDLSMTLLLLIIMAIISMVQNNVSAAMDESVQTAQDYSVIVDDPSPNDGDTQVRTRLHSFLEPYHHCFKQK